MTDFRARGTIMGPAGLTAVFGMGTGGTPPVSSPEIGRGEDQSPRPRWFARPDGGEMVAHARGPFGEPGPACDATGRSGRRRVGVVKPLGC